MKEIKKEWLTAWLTAWRTSGGNPDFEIFSDEHRAREHARKLIEDGVSRLVFVAEVQARAEREVVFK